MSKRIVLIGGSGFVGTRLIDLFQQKDYEIQNIDKQQSHFFPNITAIGDVRDKVDAIVTWSNGSCIVSGRTSG